ncbi:hypothetical protein BASA81_015731 [Batrachochytrium salamandrivorans]|nr:hypothetical protein BASA81_015731 [Batrachochytrium salamandrivorans]
MQLLDKLRALFPWEPIKNCPGRFVVRKLGDELSPQDLLLQISPNDGEGKEYRSQLFIRPGQDDVFVAVFHEGGGGLITFCKPDKRFVHTLNEPHGLERKLWGLGLQEMLA